jgi:hypothetical protein
MMPQSHMRAGTELSRQTINWDWGPTNQTRGHATHQTMLALDNATAAACVPYWPVATLAAELRCDAAQRVYSYPPYVCSISLSVTRLATVRVPQGA